MTDPTAATIVICLPVDDRPTSSAFYRALLDRQPPGQPQDDGEPEPLQFTLNAETSLMLIPRGGFGWVSGAEPEDTTPVGGEVLLSREATDEEQVRAWARAAASAGGRVIVEPARQPWGFTAVVADPDGHRWQLFTDDQATQRSGSVGEQ
jgi:predicted lactoylglutathione lyase